MLLGQSVLPWYDRLDALDYNDTHFWVSVSLKRGDTTVGKHYTLILSFCTK